MSIRKRFRVYKPISGEMFYLSNSPISELHLTLNNNFWSLMDGRKRICGNAESESVLMQSTPFTDNNLKLIYDGDILSDYTQTDEGLKKSHCQVFWCDKTGMWRLDMSSKQNKSYSFPLYKELKQYKYEILGNVHQNPELLAREIEVNL